MHYILLISIILSYYFGCWHPRRSVSMGSSLDHVDKDVYYWEPKSLRIRCQPVKPMGRRMRNRKPMGFSGHRKKTWENPSKYKLMSSLKTSIENIEDGHSMVLPIFRRARYIAMIGSGQTLLLTVVLTSHMMIRQYQCIPSYSDTEQLLKHQPMIFK